MSSPEHVNSLVKKSGDGDGRTYQIMAPHRRGTYVSYLIHQCPLNRISASSISTTVKSVLIPARACTSSTFDYTSARTSNVIANIL